MRRPFSSVRLAVMSTLVASFLLSGMFTTIPPVHSQIFDSPVPITEPVPEHNAWFAFSVATGDVNSDGMDDVIVGVPNAKPGGLYNAGEVFVFWGPDLTTWAALTEPTTQESARFGFSVAAGDINNDGYDDVIVGAVGADDEGVELYNFGEVFVFFGPTLSDSIRLEEPTPESGAGFGSSVAAGDVDGDGNDDVIVGAPYSPSPYFRGEAFVFLSYDSIRFTSVITLTEPERQNDAQFGMSVAAGDVDGDGKDDVIVGAPQASPGDPVVDEAGEAFVFKGPDLTIVTTLTTLEDGANFGTSVAAGDVDNDSYDDVIVGAPSTSRDGVDHAGKAFVFWGPALSLYSSLMDYSTIIEEGRFGKSVAAGDFDNDGNDDVIVGAYSASPSGVLHAGKALSFPGPDLPWIDEHTFTQPTLEGGANFGFSVATGDVDNDGWDDVIVGAHRAEVSGEYSAGKAFYFHALNTHTGTDVSVQPVDKTTETIPVTVTFQNVTDPGTTSLTTSNSGPPPPVGFRSCTTPTYYDITTTAESSGTIQLELGYTELDCQNGEQLSVFVGKTQKPTMDFQLLSSILKTMGDMKTATVTRNALSFFALFEPAVQAIGLEPPMAELVPEGELPIPLPRNTFKLGQTLPLKLQLVFEDRILTDADVAAPQIVELVRQGDDPIDLESEDIDAGIANDSDLRFRFSELHWVYNLSTKGLSTGTYAITIEILGVQRFIAGFVLS